MSATCPTVYKGTVSSSNGSIFLPARLRGALARRLPSSLSRWRSLAPQSRRHGAPLARGGFRVASGAPFAGTRLAGQLPGGADLDLAGLGRLADRDLDLKHAVV